MLVLSFSVICGIAQAERGLDCSKSSAPHSAFASARLIALRRLVAGRAFGFEQELCTNVAYACVSQEKVEIHFIFTFSIDSNE
mgnify:CR=1 FL=1